jgi:hypothetical protein
LYLLCPPFDECCKYIGGEGHRFSSSEDAVNFPGDGRRWHESQHGDMIDLLQLKPKRREVHIPPAIEQGLRLAVRHPSRSLTGKPRRLDVEVGLLLPATPLFAALAQRRRTSSAVRVAIGWPRAAKRLASFTRSLR